MGDNQTYKTGQLADILGLTRDALRYYEEKGIINPKHKQENNYREYDFYDIYTLMVTDFYKKRNLAIKEVKKLQSGSELDELEALLGEKATELEEIIRIKESTLRKINETREFCKDIKNHVNRFSLRKLPLYEIKGEISDFNAVEEYHVILEKMDLMKEDILSKIVKRFTFDESGFLDFKMFIVDKSDSKLEDKSYIDYSTCIYTIVEDGRFLEGNEDPKITAFTATLNWATEQGLTLQGVAFAFTRLITYIDGKERIFLEIFVPVNEK